ncbi:Superoxide dismutase [Cu-Zn], partial [Blattella germanica]
EGRKAIAVLTNEDNSIKGTINFTQAGVGQEVKVTGSISGLSVGEHGFHIHAKGDITGKCTGAAGHFNPENKTHGSPNDTDRHVGDLGNINTTSTDLTVVDITDRIISLYGAHNIIGRAVVVHENRDDLGLGNHSSSSTTGNAGGRLACGVIGIQ